MALKVANAAEAAKKFAARGSAATPEYAAGVRGAGADWLAQTTASAENYAAGVQQAIGRNAFARGVQAAGASKFESRSAGVGARRFAEGIREAESAYNQAIQPVLQTLAGLNLPPRRPTGDPANYLRSQAVGEALRRMKTGG